MSTSKTYHHGDLRTALLETTRELVVEQGLEALSLREVSRRAGVSHTAAYNHFPNKTALVHAFVDDAFRAFALALEAGRDAGTEPIDALRRIGVAYVRFAFDHPAQFKVMFRPELSGIAEHGELATAERAYDVLVDGIDTALRAGLVRGDRDALVRVSWAVVHGLALLILDGPGESIAPTSATLDMMTSISLGFLLDGMRTRG